MEARLVPPLLEWGAEYEPLFLRFSARNPRRYTPDVILPNGIAIEIKGWFPPDDRSKLLDVKASYPALDLRMVLASPNATLNKRSATTQAEWCESHGIPWAHNVVPDAWLHEAPNKESFAILNNAPRTNRSAS